MFKNLLYRISSAFQNKIFLKPKQLYCTTYFGHNSPIKNWNFIIQADSEVSVYILDNKNLNLFMNTQDYVSIYENRNQKDHFIGLDNMDYCHLVVVNFSENSTSFKKKFKFF